MLGLTLVEPLASVDENEPGRIVMLDAPLVAQLRVALEPALILPGFAPKEVMTGADPTPGAVPADASWQVAKLGVFRANPSVSIR